MRWHTLWLSCWSICTTSWTFECRGIHFLNELNSIVAEEASEDTSGLETEPGMRRETWNKAPICDTTASFNKLKVVLSRYTHGESTWPSGSLLCWLFWVFHTLPPFLDAHFVVWLLGEKCHEGLSWQYHCRPFGPWMSTPIRHALHYLVVWTIGVSDEHFSVFISAYLTAFWKLFAQYLDQFLKRRSKLAALYSMSIDRQ